nr:hypothetical protein CFP56_74695 [Quercus suber]
MKSGGRVSRLADRLDEGARDRRKDTSRRRGGHNGQARSGDGCQRDRTDGRGQRDDRREGGDSTRERAVRYRRRARKDGHLTRGVDRGDGESWILLNDHDARH